MALTERSDAELLIQFREPATKEAAYTAIIKKYQERLYWHIRRMVVDHDDANDVLQNVFIRVWNGLVNFREDAQLYTCMGDACKPLCKASSSSLASCTKPPPVPPSVNDGRITNGKPISCANSLPSKNELAVLALATGTPS